MEALHLSQFENTVAAPPPAQLPPGARVTLISDFFTDIGAVEKAVTALASDGAAGALVQICDPAEEDFPFDGRIEFKDLESRDRLIFGETGKLGPAYKAKFAAHREALAALARKVGWTFIAHRTDRPAQTALLSLFTALGDMRVWAK